MSTWRRRKWRKIHEDFATSTKLRTVGPHALALLAAMTSQAWWDDESTEGRMYESDGVPMPLEDVWALAQLNLRQGRIAWDTLASKRTVGVVDGVPALLNFREHQKGDSTERMRRHRGVTSPSRDADVTVTSPSQVTDSRMQSAEAEVEPPPAPSEGAKAKGSRKGKPRKARADYPDGLDEHLLQRLRSACEQVNRKGPSKITDDLRDALRKLWAACEPSTEDIDHVVAVRLDMTRRGVGMGHLTWDSICVASNFRRWLAEPIGEQVTQRYDVTPDELERRVSSDATVTPIDFGRWSRRTYEEDDDDADAR